MRALPRRQSQQEEASPTPEAEPAEDLGYDFEFSQLKLDLSLGVGRSAWETQTHPARKLFDSREDNTGIAVSSSTEPRGRLRTRSPRTEALESPYEAGIAHPEGSTTIPPSISEPRTTFCSQTETTSKEPSCSIYSREWRRRERRSITSSDQVADETLEKISNHIPQKPSIARAESHHLTEADKNDDIGESPSPGPGESAVSKEQTEEMSLSSLQTNQLVTFKAGGYMKKYLPCSRGCSPRPRHRRTKK